MSVTLRLDKLTEKNTQRCIEVFHPIDDWSPTDWACAMAGEAGEVCNAVKKLKRLTDGVGQQGDPQSAARAIQDIADEVGDTIIYLDLLCTRLGINMGEAIVGKFNTTSIRFKSDVQLQLSVLD